MMKKTKKNKKENNTLKKQERSFKKEMSWSDQNKVKILSPGKKKQKTKQKKTT